jgi:Sec-independent protein secretion pathway component TatC
MQKQHDLRSPSSSRRQRRRRTMREMLASLARRLAWWMLVFCVGSLVVLFLSPTLCSNWVGTIRAPDWPSSTVLCSGAAASARLKDVFLSLFQSAIAS